MRSALQKAKPSKTQAQKLKELELSGLVEFDQEHARYKTKSTHYGKSPLEGSIKMCAWQFLMVNSLRPAIAPLINCFLDL